MITKITAPLAVWNVLPSFVSVTEGHEIIICTARNMVTSRHNVGRAVKNVGLATLESLRQLGIEYDEIHFGKPLCPRFLSFAPCSPSLFKKRVTRRF
ncbi:hypothetical protein DFJ74DRAFT_156387 [Hyaloraphidium curvatum]|nr:hypothetical protein DFJ74DRAFT_156387 [Hyaloraphidium curvatum]